MRRAEVRYRHQLRLGKRSELFAFEFGAGEGFTPVDVEVGATDDHVVFTITQTECGLGKRNCVQVALPRAAVPDLVKKLAGPVVSGLVEKALAARAYR